VYAKVKKGDTELSLRSAAITNYAGARVPEPAPAPPQTAAGARRIVAFTEVARTSPVDGQEKIDRHRTMDGKEPKLRKLSQLASDLRARFVEQGGDELWFGTVAGEMHLATEAQAGMTAAQAITAQREALRALYPDAPLDRLFAPPEEAPWHNRGMTVGICAQDCKEKVDARGVKSGCTEEIRTKNLLSCSNVPFNDKKPKDKGANLCSTAVPEPEKRPLKAVHCYSSLGTCHHVRHDKSKCFLQTVVRGVESEERERWYVSIPLITDDWRKEKHRKWPYHGNHAGASEGTKVPPHRNLRVLLVNPQNGNAVVCSMEDFGPSGNESEGNAAIPQAGIARDELLGMGHLCGLSPEVNWKLGFMHGHGNPVVLMAFVPADTALGPVPEGATIELRKRATYLQIMGVDPVPEKP
jgi:hypothetical protein